MNIIIPMPPTSNDTPQFPQAAPSLFGRRVFGFRNSCCFRMMKSSSLPGWIDMSLAKAGRIPFCTHYSVGGFSLHIGWRRKVVNAARRFMR